MNLPWAIFFSCLLLTGCQKYNENMDDPDRVEFPDQEGWGIGITLSESGKTRALVKSDYLKKYETEKKVNLAGNVVADFFDTDEKHTTLVFSDYASINEQTGFMTASGYVVVVSDSGITLVTDTLTLDQESELIFTDDSVMLTTTTEDTLYGIGFESNIHLDEWKIIRPWGVTELENDKK